MQGPSYHQGESPLKAMFKDSSKGEKEEFMIWLVDKYPDFVCLLLRSSIHAGSVECRIKE
jgi:hypothetical protein